jgi:amidohydrolase
MFSPDEIDQVVSIAHTAFEYLHENPELGDEEHLAHEYITNQLKQYGYVDFFSVAKAPTAVITWIDSGRPGPVIGLRCELDARKIVGQEEPLAHQPRSKVPGLMHNCGHDAHAAMLLAVSKLLATRKDAFCGKIVLLFQPAEETVGGAPFIVEDGILQRLGVEALFALHVEPKLSVGKASLEPGVFLAGSSYFKVELTGRGSHAAQPQNGSDMPVVASEVTRILANLPARSIDVANEPTLISVTKLVCDSDALNVIPSSATVAGTIRAFRDPHDDTLGNSLAALIEQRLAGVSKSFGVDHQLTIRSGSPPCRNDERLFAKAISVLRSKWSGEISTSTRRFMTAEDFAFYTNVLPCLYFSLGIAKEGLGEGDFHTTDFRIHPDALRYGILLWVTVISENISH